MQAGVSILFFGKALKVESETVLNGVNNRIKQSRPKKLWKVLASIFTPSTISKVRRVVDVGDCKVDLNSSAGRTVVSQLQGYVIGQKRP